MCLHNPLIPTLQMWIGRIRSSVASSRFEAGLYENLWAGDKMGKSSKPSLTRQPQSSHSTAQFLSALRSDVKSLG